MDAGMRDALVKRDPPGQRLYWTSLPPAASMFVDPTGSPVGDQLSDEEGIAYAEFDLSRCVEPKQFHDVVGYDNRFDVFSLSVNRERQEPVSWREGASSASASAPVSVPVTAAEGEAAVYL